jgi:hypothetical protein
MTTSLEAWMLIFPEPLRVMLAPLMVMSPLLLRVMLALPEVRVIWSSAVMESFLPIWRVSPLLTPRGRPLARPTRTAEGPGPSGAENRRRACGRLKQKGQNERSRLQRAR